MSHIASDTAAPRVLVVDDEELFRHSLVEALESSCPDYRVEQAADGREALERAAAALPDVVVTDVKMPEMDGLELLLKLKEGGYRGSVLLVTAFGSAQLAEHADLCGAFGYLNKPVDLPQLIGAVRGAVEGHRSAIRGLTLAGFSQLLAMERKTAALKVHHQDQEGELRFHQGTLVDARLGLLEGEEAALAIFGWETDDHLELISGFRPWRTTIQEGLNSLLMEAMRLRDEEAAEGTAEPVETAPTARFPQLQPTRIQDVLEAGMKIEGAQGIVLLSAQTGRCLGSAGEVSGKGLERLTESCASVVRVKEQLLARLGIDDPIDDVMITYSRSVHLIRPLTVAPGLYFLLVLRRDANLALARRGLGQIEKNLLL